MRPSRRKLLLISIDCPVDQSFDSPGVQAGFVWQLAGLFGSFGVPAGWNFSDPAATPLARQILRQPGGQRIGVLVEPDWAGPSADRTQFARQLARRVESAAERGIHVRSITPRGVDVRQHLDLLVRHKLAVIRWGEDDGKSAAEPLQICSQRFGIWEARVSVHLPSHRRWFGCLNRSHRSILAGHLARRKWNHLVLDLPSLAQDPQRNLKALARCLALVQRQVASGSLVCLTSEQLAERFNAVRLNPGRSAVVPRPHFRPAA
ncbi:MAG: hypothetical protein J5I93_06725 [Pirellulaceae bacterium]|nr:hypothetical protein [Pirellulaceae bacterium]